MTNPSKRDSAARKVVAVARSIVTYEIGIPAGCVRMSRTLSWLAPYEADLPKVFEEYLRQVQSLPLTSERLGWDRSVLREKDKILEATNQQFRDQIFDTCWALIDRFSQDSPEAVGPFKPDFGLSGELRVCELNSSGTKASGDF